MNGSRQVTVNQDVWRRGEFVRDYNGRFLRPVEVMILARHREPLSGRVLELGCGAGRVLGYLCALSDDVTGVDLAPRMVDEAARAYPQAKLRLGDLSDPSSCAEGRYDAIWMANNVIDLLDDTVRRRVLGELTGMLEPDAVLIFSSHNLDAVELVAAAGPPARDGLGGHLAEALGALRRVAWTPPAEALLRLGRAPRRRRNRRDLASQEYRNADHAVLNDPTHDYSLLMYYIRRDAQEQQLAELGYELIECLDMDGRVVPPGGRSLAPELHYIARRLSR
jgi:SAM-dependent methyltransferase